MFRGPRHVLWRIHLWVHVFEGENICAYESLPLHTSSEPVCHFHIDQLLDVFGIRVPNGSSWDFELNDDILRSEGRVFSSGKIDRAHFADRHASQFNERTERKILYLACHIRFEDVTFSEIRFQSNGEEGHNK